MNKMVLPWLGLIFNSARNEQMIAYSVKGFQLSSLFARNILVKLIYLME